MATDIAFLARSRDPWEMMRVSLLALILVAAPTLAGADNVAKNTIKAGAKTGGHAVRDGARTGGRTVKTFFQSGAGAAKAEAKAGGAKTRERGISTAKGPSWPIAG